MTRGFLFFFLAGVVVGSTTGWGAEAVEEAAGLFVVLAVDFFAVLAVDFFAVLVSSTVSVVSIVFSWSAIFIFS